MTDEPVERAFRAEWPAVVAALTRSFGDVDLAEEAAQEAFVTAAAWWGVDGVPENPGGWLMSTARHRALDRLRRVRVRASAQAELRAVSPAFAPAIDLPSVEAPETPGPDDALHDDRLRLVFLCCHPALALDARVALTLRLVCGLTVPEIARAFLVSEAAMQQRLVRAKRKLRAARPPFTVPGARELPERLGGVLAVLYLVFNEGFSATAGSALVRADLCAEAIRLARLVAELLPDDSEARGLLALMLLHDARRSARQDAAGHAVALSDQDRARWDGEQVTVGVAELERALAGSRPGRYQIQAAISALHATAPSWEDTDWAQIAALYGELARRAQSPVVELNRAIAVGMADGPVAGLAVLSPVLAGGDLDGHAPLHAAHAELLERSGDLEAAAAAWRRAAGSTGNDEQRRALLERARAACA